MYNKLKTTKYVRFKMMHVVTMTIIYIVFLVLSRIGYAPFIGTFIAEREMNHYLLGHDKTVTVTNVKFDWYNGGYVGLLGKDNRLTYHLNNNTIIDYPLMRSLDIGLNVKYREILNNFPENLIFPDEISAWTAIDASDYSQYYQQLYVLGISNIDSEIEETESRRMAADIGEELIYLLGSDYNFTGIQLIYHDKNGVWEVAIRATRSGSLTREDLHRHTKERS